MLVWHLCDSSINTVYQEPLMLHSVFLVWYECMKDLHWTCQILRWHYWKMIWLLHFSKVVMSQLSVAHFKSSLSLVKWIYCTFLLPEAFALNGCCSDVPVPFHQFTIKPFPPGQYYSAQVHRSSVIAGCLSWPRKAVCGIKRLFSNKSSGSRYSANI